jgi:Putative DNA-binding domain
VRPSPSLADLQRWMRWALTHPLGVSRATAAERLAGFPRRFEHPGMSVLPWIAADTLPGRTALDRLAVYGNGYFARLLGTLQLAYPRLESALGAGPFRELIAAHLLRRPSTSPSLADLGAGMATTLRESRLAAGSPWVVDLACLERAAAEVWLAGTGPFPPLAPPPGTGWDDARLELSPAVRLLDLGWDVAAWKPGAAPPEAREHLLVVWRTGSSTEVEALETGPGLLLGALADGSSLAEACGIAEFSGLSAESVGVLFSEWTGRGWFARAVGRGSTA